MSTAWIFWAAMVAIVLAACFGITAIMINWPERLPARLAEGNGRHTPHRVAAARDQAEAPDPGDELDNDDKTIAWLIRLRLSMRHREIPLLARARVTVAAFRLALDQATDTTGEPRCPVCRDRLDARCDHPCCSDFRNWHGVVAAIEGQQRVAVDHQQKPPPVTCRQAPWDTPTIVGPEVTS